MSKKVNIPLLVLRDVVSYAAVFFMLWQARWIIEYRLLAGETYEYGVLSLYLSSSILILAIILNGIVEKKKVVVSSFIWLSLMWIVIGTFWSADQRLAGFYILSLVISYGYYILIRLWSRYKALLAIIYASILQVAIAWYQHVAQKVTASTLLGVAEHLPSTAGTSVVMIEGERVLRAYGFAPHPNILGMFLFIGLASLIYLFIMHERHYRSSKLNQRTVWYYVGILWVWSGILLTFSRATFLMTAALLLGWLWYAVLRRRKKLFKSLIKLIALIFIVFISFNVFFGNVWFDRFGFGQAASTEAQRLEDISVDNRILGYQQAYSVLDTRTVFLGKGIGQYLTTIAEQYPGLPTYAYQPVHNVYILLMIEIGLIGSGLIAWLIALTLTRSWKRNKAVFAYRFFTSVLAIVALSGLLDHLLWTSYLGMSLWWLILGLAVKND